uniref:Uncharacterized protein n=1 Tax=candidate division WWE3 bacterium TaxID=2053526 RepID=A0A831Z291_UNCKA
MRIKSSVLRFGAGLLVLVGILAAAVSLLYGVGVLAESWWCAGRGFNFLCSYDVDGFTFWMAVGQGYTSVSVLGLAGAIFWLVFRAARGLGNRFFDPKK